MADYGGGRRATPGGGTSGGARNLVCASCGRRVVCLRPKGNLVIIKQLDDSREVSCLTSCSFLQPTSHQQTAKRRTVKRTSEDGS